MTGLEQLETNEQSRNRVSDTCPREAEDSLKESSMPELEQLRIKIEKCYIGFSKM